MNKITIIIITYKSEKIIYDFIKKIPTTIKTIIVENSQNYELKEKIEQNHKNISVFIKENNGVSSALNFAVEKIETKYFLQISPDIEFNFKNLEIFLNYAKKINDRFAALGPRFLNTNKKSHKQIDEKLDSGEISSIHGSCMFINKENFKIIGKFDENFFLYFEEIDLCKNVKRNKGKIYLSQNILIKHEGGSSANELKKNELEKNRNWHWMWSTFYFHKKYKGFFLALIIILPKLLSSLIKTVFYWITLNKDKRNIYYCRLSGILNSIIGKKSWYRPPLD